MFSQYEVASLAKELKALGVTKFKAGDFELDFGPQTYINKVEIAVNSNQDPSRIARMIRQDLLNVAGPKEETPVEF